jgi:hypothetical protein
MIEESGSGEASWADIEWGKSFKIIRSASSRALLKPPQAPKIRLKIILFIGMSKLELN